MKDNGEYNIKGVKRTITYLIDNNGCFNCNSHYTKIEGYQYVSYNKKRWRLNRLIYCLMKEEIPKDLVVIHICGNSKCINPNHLFLGTIADSNKNRSKISFLHYKQTNTQT